MVIFAINKNDVNLSGLVTGNSRIKPAYVIIG